MTNSTTPQHTPGPWAPYHNKSHCGATTIDYFGVSSLAITDENICSTVCHIADPGGRGRQEVLANAQLIAASPELLNALEDLVATITDALELDDTGTDIDGYTLITVAAAKEAINKARGGRN